MTTNNAVESFKEFLATNPTPEKIVNVLYDTHRSIGYELIDQAIDAVTLKRIQNDKELYQLFQDIKGECKKSYDYDNKPALIKEVNASSTNVYTILLNVIGQQNSVITTMLDILEQSINKIEEKLDLPKTDLNAILNAMAAEQQKQQELGEVENANTNEDVEGSGEDI